MQPDSNQSSPGSRGASPRGALIAALVFALSLAGCLSRDFVSSARVRIENLRVVSEKRVGRTLFEYQLAADCRNAAPPVHGVTALAISGSPETAIVQGVLHCGPLLAGESKPSLDSITIRQDRRQPFNPASIEWIAASYGSYHKKSEARFDRTNFDYVYRLDITNLGAVPRHVVATARSTAPDLHLLDAVVEVNAPPNASVTPLDSFSFRLDRTHPFDPKTIEWDLRLGAADTSPPTLELFVPSQVQTGAALRATARAGDDVGVSNVQFFVDGLLVGTDPSAPYELAYNAPDEPGRVLAIRAVAIDTTGNASEKQASVAVTAVPDQTPPVIDALHLPPSAAPGATLTVRANVSDDRGVAMVRLSLDGAPQGSVGTPPYELSFRVPSGARPGQSLAIDVEAEDTSGNRAHVQGTIAVVAAPDQTPPSGVGILAPQQATPGQTIRLDATAVDEVGILAVAFFADGALLASDGETPYEAHFSVPSDKPVGTQISFHAEATDFSGNHTASAPVTLAIVEAGLGSIGGEVYDDTTGLPLAAARVAVLESRGAPPASPQLTTTDVRGRYHLRLAEGKAVLAISHDGMTSALREVAVESGRVVTPLDARLTPIGVTRSILAAAGGTVVVAGQSLAVPPGAFAADTEMSLTALGAQGLPAPLPLGWSPLAAFDVGPGAAVTQTPLELTLSGLDLGHAVAARFDPSTRRWLRSEIVVPDSGMPRVLLPGTGVVAIVQADTAPTVPPEAALGEALEGVAAVAIPSGATAELLPSPHVIFMDPSARSAVSARLRDAATLPSGTPFEVDFAESYARTDGSETRPAPFTQDVLFYRGAQGPEAAFAASPSRVFDPASLREGSINLAAHRPAETEGSAEIGPAGGPVASPSGVSLLMPPAALLEPTPVSVRSLSIADSGLASDARFVVLAVIDVDLDDSALASAATLGVSLAAPLPADAQVLALRAVEVLGATRQELVGIATANGATLTLVAGAAGLPLPGVVEGGRYTLIWMKDPVGFATGSIRTSGAPAASAFATSDAFPFVSLTDAASPGYALAAPLGASSLEGTGLEDGSRGSAALALATRGEVATRDLELGASRPTVISVTPVDGATAVDAYASITLRFSRAMDAATIDASALRLQGPAGPIAASVSLLPDGVTAALRPAAVLANDALFSILVSTAAHDRFGNALFGNQPDESFASGFRTSDSTPPPRPEAGQVEVSPPAAGRTTIHGSQGAVEPGALVAVRNLATGLITTVLAGPDGSFSLSVAASLTDGLELTLTDAAGNATSLDLGRAPPPLGTGLVGPEGGVVEGAGGVAALIPAGTLPRDTEVTVTPLDPASLPSPFGPDLSGRVGGALRLSLGGVEIADVMELRFDVDGRSETRISDRVPEFVIDQIINLPTDAIVGEPLTLHVDGRDKRGHAAELHVKVQIVSATPDATPRTTRSETMPVLSLIAPAEATPGQAIRIVAQAAPPDIKLRVPADASIRGDEQILLLEVTEWQGRPFFNLLDTASVKTLPGGERVIESNSPPFRGPRKNLDQLIFAVMQKQALAFAKVLIPASTSSLGPLVAALEAIQNAEGDAAYLGALLRAFGAPRSDVSPYEFGVIPLPAGVPGTIRVFDFETNNELGRIEVEALPPGTFSAVLVLGEDDNEPVVTATTSPANRAVPVDAGISVAFSHLIDTGTITPNSLYIQDSTGRRLDVRIVLPEGDDPFAVMVKPMVLLQAGKQYKLVAKTGIKDVGGKTLAQAFEMSFTAGLVPEVIGSLDLAGAGSLDVVHGVALVSDRTGFFTVDLTDPTTPVVLGRVVLDPSRAGLVRYVHGMANAAFPNGLGFAGDLAILDAGSSETFSALRYYSLADPTHPEHLGGTLVGSPVSALILSQELTVVPDPKDPSSFTVYDPTPGLLDGIPKLPAQPWVIDTDGDRTAYFVNQGVGLMTIDLSRAIPPPPIPQRGMQFGPSYAPVDKAGGIVAATDPALDADDGIVALTTPSDLTLVTTPTASVKGKVSLDGVESLIVNGFSVDLPPPTPGVLNAPRNFSLDLPLHEGVNRVLASGFGATGAPLGAAGITVLRSFTTNPLAGPGTVTVSIPPLAGTTGATQSVTATVTDRRKFDQIYVNGLLASEKRCPLGTSRKYSECGWSGAGSVTVPLRPGSNAVVATAIDLDSEEVDGPGGFFDLEVEEGLALAVHGKLFLFDASSLVPLGTAEIEGNAAFRVSIAKQVLTDLDDDDRSPLAENDDGDTITIFEEQKNLALVGSGSSGRLTFVDVTEPHHAAVLGWLDTGAGAYRAWAIPKQGIAYLATGAGILQIDLTHPNHEGLWDTDGDGRDDRILAEIPLAGAQDLRLDEGKGLATVLRKGAGISVVRLDACDKDIGVDATRLQTPRTTRAATLQKERQEIFEGIQSGLAKPECASVAAGGFALLAQGSSACIWRPDERCSSAYQPGISDYDFELFTDATGAEACAKVIEEQIVEKSAVSEDDLSVFTESRAQFEAAYRAVGPRASGSCGAGGDPYGDLCLGRTGLMLKWILEGEWVRGGGTVYDGGIDLDAIHAKLRSPLPATYLNDPTHREPSHVPLLEGREWVCLEDFALAKSLARIRVRGAGLGDVPIVDPDYLRKIHNAAKAGIRTIYGKLLASEIGNRLLLDSNRTAYNGPSGCRTARGSGGAFGSKPCDSFEEFVAGKAIESVQRNLGLLSNEEANLAYEFYRRKADVGLQIADEQAANEFIASAINFIDGAVADPAITAPYGATVGFFNDGSQRQSNLSNCGSKIPDYEPGGAKFKIKVPLRLFNSGYGAVSGPELVFYHDGSEVKRSEPGVPAPGGSTFFSKKEFEHDALEGGLHSVQFRIDPENQIPEYDKRSNDDGFFYYVLDPDDTAPPETVKFRPDPPSSAPLPDPPASEMCLDSAGAAPPSPGVEVISVLDGQYDRSVDPGTSVTRTWIVRNTGNAALNGLVIQDSALGAISVGSLAAGASTTATRSVSASAAGSFLYLSTLTGEDADGNGIGVASTYVKLGVVEPRYGIAVRIVSPPRSRNPHDPDESEPFETSSADIPVSGIVESTAAITSVEVNGVLAAVTGAAPRWEFRTSHPVPLAVGANDLVATARSAGDEEATDRVTVRRLGADCMTVEKRVDGQDRKRVRPGDTVTYTVHVEAGPRDLTAVTLLETNPETRFAPSPFDLAAGATRDFSFSYTVPSGFDGGSIENEVVATAADADGGTCGPISDSAELWTDELVLKPKLIVLGVATATAPKTKQLEVTYTPLDRDVSAAATGTRFEWIDNGLPATTAIDVYEYIREKLKGANLPAVPSRAQLETDAQGRLIAKSNGWNVVRAVHRSELTGGLEIRSNYSIVLVGAELKSIQITPRSLLSTVSGGVGDAIEAVKRQLDKKAKASPDVDKKGNPPLVLANGPILCGATRLANASRVVAQTGYLELTSVQFKLFGGLIDGVDLLAAARRGLGALATAYGGPAGAPIGWALGKALNVGVTHAVDFTVKDPAVLSVRSGFGSGLATANAAGMTLVTGTLDLGDLGKKKDDVLSFVIPELLSTELRTDPTYLRGPECVESLHVFSKVGSSHLSVSFGFPARLVDYGIDAVGAAGTAKYLRKLVPAGVPIPSTGRGNVVILPDDGQAPVSLEMEAELTLNELKIYGFVIGVKTPTLLTRYAPAAFPGLPTGPPLDPSVATYLPERAFDQPVKGIGPYRTRASVQTCIPFVGQQTDIYDPAANAGGASILVGRSACSDPPQAMDDLATTCADTAARIDALANDTANAPTVAIDGAAANGQLFVNPDQTIDYVANAGFKGADFFTYRLTDAYGATATARVDVTVVDCGQNPGVTGARPIAVDDDAEVNEDELVNVDVADNDIDPNGTGLRVTIEIPPLHGTAVVEPDGSITYGAPQHGSGIETVGYRIVDGAGSSASASLRIDVNACPTADAGEVEFLLDPAIEPTSTLDGSASSDPEGDPLLYFWTQIGGPPVVLTGPEATPSFSVPPVVDEPIVFELVVSDGRCESDPAAVLRVPLRLAGVVINEVVPGANSQVELRNVGQTVWDLRGWTLGGYVLGSTPARERYVSTTTGGTAAVDAFHPDAYAVIEFPGRNLATTFLVLESNLLPGQPVDSAEVGAPCVPNAGLGRPSLARIGVPTSQDVCADFEWRSTASMGRPN